MRAAALLALGLAWLVTTGPAQAQDPLATADIRVLGLAVDLDTRPDLAGLQDTMTAVKDVPTGLETFLGSPVDPAVRAAPAGALVRAELRGPTFGDDVVELAAPPNQLVELPLFRVPGEHRITNVRLEDAAGVVLLARDPELPPVRIDVIDQLLVSSVTTRPLTLEEIEARGIVIDEDNFTALNFAVGLTLGSEQVTIDLPVLVPTSNQALTSQETPQLITLNPEPDQIRRINIPNFSLSGFSLRTPPELDEVDAPQLPPIHGVIVIPGNIAFLNQFFSVLLQVTNAAPGSSGLTVQAARATIALPRGEDGIADTGDDPLRVAETVSGGVATELPLLDPTGAPALPPQGTNTAEFLVEGLREGTHRVDFDVRGDLFVPALGRSVELTGIAAGVVQVRNPTFSMVLAHPRVVREGESYSLFTTVTNTSSSPANLFRLELARRSLSGASLAEGETGLRTLDQLPPGEAETFEFRLVARTTGEVTGTVFLAEEGLNGSFVLTTGVGDRDIPLSPDTLVLPQTVDFLPDEPDFVAAAVRVLGMAYSVATAPARALPPDVARVGRAHVFDRAVKLAQAGLHVRFGQAPDHAVEDVLLDWYGNDRGRLETLVPDEAERGAFLRDIAAFDALRRTTGAGRDFDAVAGALLGQAASADSTAGLLRTFATRFASRPAFLAVAGVANGAPVPLELRAAGGERLGRLDPAAPLLREIPYAARLPLRAETGAEEELLLVASPDPGAAYTVAFAAPAGASDLELVAIVPRAAGLALVTFPRVALGARATGRLVIATGSDAELVLEVDGDADGVVETRLAPLAIEPVADEPPALLGVQQWGKGELPEVSPSFESGDPIGRMLGVLFSEEVTPASAERALAYALPENAPVSVSLQPDRRLAFVVFEKPFGPFVPRSLVVEGVEDLHGQPMPRSERPVAADPERGVGGRVVGRVLTAAGRPIPFAEVRYIQPLYAFSLFECFPKDFAISTHRADAEGRFAIEFVLRNEHEDVCTPDVWLNQRSAGGTNHFKLEAEDPETGEVGRLSTRVQFDGQALRLDLVIRGFGAIEGRVFEEDGSPVVGGDPGSPEALRVFARNLSTGELVESWVDADGRYAFPRRFVGPNGQVAEAPALPVGNVSLLTVRPADGATAVTTVNLPAAGARVTGDLVLLPPFRYGAVSGVVFESDGRTPAASTQVFLAGRILAGFDFGGRRDLEGLLASAVTDATGAFRFENVPAGDVLVVAQRASTFEEAEARGVAPEGGETQLQLVLPGGGGTVRGIVLDSLGNPVPGATVAGGTTLANADEDGRFEIRGLPRGSVTVYGQGLDSPALGTVQVSTTGPEDLQEVVITLQPIGSVGGTVLEADGTTPVAAQKVQLWVGASGVAAEAYTDEDGTFLFSNYPLGKYSLRAIRPDESDGGMAETEIRFAGDIRDADIRFRGAGEITGRVIQSNGTPAITDVVVTRKVWRIIPDTAGPIDNAALALEILAQYAQIPGLEESVAQTIAENRLDAAPPEFFILIDETAILRSDELGPGGEVTGRFTFLGPITGGPFTVAAFGPFLAPAVVTGEIPRTADPAERRVDVGDIVLEPATGSVRGTVYLPDGVTPVGENVAVRLRSLDNSGSVPAVGGTVEQPVLPEIEVVTDEDGRFEFPLVLRGSFALTADTGAPPAAIRASSVEEMQTEAFEDAEGNRLLNVRLFGEARGSVPVLEFGQFVTADVRLRDVAGARVRVVESDGTTPVEGARVAVSTASTLDSDPPAAFTDANGEVTFFPLLEGPFSVSVSLLGDVRRGSASGAVPENGPNGLELPITVQLGAVTTASGQIVESEVFGSVAGTVFRADGTPLDNPAQVTVTSRGVQILASTDGDGRYLAENVPGGPFRVNVFEPLTSRRGFSTGSLGANGATVEAPVTLVGLGGVIGSVFSSDGSQVRPGVDVELAPSGNFSDRLVTRTDASGVYELPGVPLGPYTVQARDFQTGLVGQANGALARDGELVTSDVFLQPSGGIAGIVFGPGVRIGAGGQPQRPDGTPFPEAPRAAGVTVQILRGNTLVQTVQTGADGSFQSGGFLPTGSYQLVARTPLADDGALGAAQIRFDAEIAFAALALAGIGVVEGVVLDSLGVAPIEGAAVTFASESPFAVGARTRITDAGGRFAFEDAPVGSFALSVRTHFQTPALGGAADGVLAVAGGRVVFEDGDADPEHDAIRLQPAGAIELSVLLADEATPAEGAVALLEGLSNGLRLSRQIDASGALRLEGIPLGSWRLSLREPVTNGVAVRLLDLVTNGEELDLGTIVLDDRGPQVIATEPAASASGADPATTILVRFDEPIAPASVTEETFVVRVAGAPLPGERELREAGRAIAFVPDAPLPDLQNVQVVVRADRLGFEGQVLEPGVRDLSDLSLAMDFGFAFTTGDSQPPQLVSLSPADGAVEVDVRAVLRFEFSEPVDLASVAGLALTRSGGAAVPGRLNDTPILGGRVLVFTPDANLAVNETYTAVLQGPVRDLAGNAMPESELRTVFATLDTEPPALASLAVAPGGALVTGRTIVLSAALAEDEPDARVEFSLGGALLGVATSPPFTQPLLLAPALGGDVTVRAVAVDAAGNRSSPRELPLVIAPNQPPAVSLLRPVSGPVSQGAVVTVEVQASDDVGLAELRYVANDGAIASGTRAAAGENATELFTFSVPADAPVGSTIAVRAAASDALGAAGQSATALLTVGDELPPVVVIGSPAAGAAFSPGSTVTVLVRGDDASGVGSLRLTVDELGFDETRPFAPPAVTAQASFTVPIPADAAPGNLTLVARAVDAAGNEATRLGSIRIADTRAPSVRLATASGSLLVEPGAEIAIDVAADDDLGVVRIELAVEGQPARVRMLVAVREASERFTVAVPAALPLGATLAVGATAFDAAGNAGAAAPLTLTVADASPPTLAIAEPAEDALVRPGESFAVRVTASDPTGVALLALAASGAAIASETRPFAPPAAAVDETFSVAVPAGAPAGAVIALAVTADDADGRRATATRIVRVADVVAPTVLAVDPAAGAADVDPGAVARVTFDEPVARASVSAATVSLACGGAPVPASLGFGGGDALVVLTPSAPLPAGASCTLSITTGVTDLAGNPLAAAFTSGFTVRSADTTPPEVLAIEPADGTTGVALATEIRITFSEPIDAASVTPESVALEGAGGAAVAAARALTAGGTVVVVTPSAPLAASTLHQVQVGTGVADLAGNALAAAVASAFTTEGPDLVGPRLVELLPAAGATGVSVRPLVRACFDDVLDLESFGEGAAAGLRVLDPAAGDEALAGTLAASTDARCVLLALEAPLGFERGYTAELRGALRGADGNPVTDAGGEAFSAIAQGFTTGRFAITAPAPGVPAVETTDLVLEASGSAELGIAEVIFEVNGEPLAPVTAAPYRRTVRVPSAAEVTELIITATARDGSGTELATDAVTVPVAVGLSFERPISGVPLGAGGALRLVASSPPQANVTIELSVHDAAILGLPNSVLFPAGADALAIPATGLAEGATAVVATSSQGTTSTIAAVSESLPLDPTAPVVAAPVGTHVISYPAAGDVVVAPSALSSVTVPVLDAPAAGPTTLVITSSAPAVADVTQTVVVPAGATSATIPIVAGAPGEALLSLSPAGDLRTGRELRVTVGTPAPDRTSPILASPVGIQVLSSPTAGDVIVAPGGTSSVTVPVLGAPAAGPTTLLITSSAPAVADVTQTVVVPAGATTATIPIVAGTPGEAVLFVQPADDLRAGRELRVTVGTPAPDRTPPVVAPPVGVQVVSFPLAGDVITAPGGVSSVSVTVFSEPAAGPTTLVITSSAPAVADVTQTVVVPTGATSATIPIVAGAPGEAVLFLRPANDLRTGRELRVTVGTPAPERTQPVLAPPVGTAVLEPGTLATLFIDPGATRTVTLPLLPFPSLADLPVQATSRSPAVATVAPALQTLPTGQRTITLTVTALGMDGDEAIVDVELPGERRTLLVVVGVPAPDRRPPAVAPPVGIEVFAP